MYLNFTQRNNSSNELSTNIYSSEELCLNNNTLTCQYPYFEFNTSPYVRLTLRKTNNLNNELETLTSYILTPYGLCGSERQSDGLLKIGRVKKGEDDKNQNDISINENDRAISRLQFVIDYRSGFKQLKPLSQELVSLLMINHERLGMYCNVINIPNEILFNVYSYTINKREFYITDCSTLGTYLKIRNEYYLKEDDIIMLGNDFELCVVDIGYSDDIKQLFDAYEIIGDFENIISPYIAIEIRNSINSSISY
jgi:hypothetical protein